MSNRVMKKMKHKTVFLQNEDSKESYRELENIPRNNPFTIPDGYFDKLPSMIMDKIDPETGSKKTFFLSLRNMRWSYKVALAASLIFIALTAAYLIFVPDYAQRLISGIQQITSSELAEFDGYLVNFDESLVDDWIARQGEGIRSAMVDTASLNEISGDDIMNYLLAEYSPEEFPLDTENDLDQ